ncbi:MAG TPA: DUF4893 domain-containing protein [Sphingomicrobium sp.]|nr:DUF4893 domain-containing protein [Sphingomicrobium sp.]
MRLALPALLLALSGCSVIEPPAGLVVQPHRDWRAIATEADRERLRDWRSAFTSALVAARASGHGEKIAREGALLDPDAALPGPAIPEGLYRCRVIKLGAKSPGMLDFVAYPGFDCRVSKEGERQAFAKLTGSQRHVGILFPLDQLRQVLLGTLILGDEAAARQYGVDPVRNLAAFLERIGPDRWRLVMPSPAFESQLDVMELVPAP